jgi:hypothetical protein
MTIPFEFRGDHHCGIKRDSRLLDKREGEHGSSNEGEEKVKSQPSDRIEDKSTWGGIAGIGKKIKVSASCEPAIAQDH